ncbi:hypothetical protein CRUP_000839 [Coryphaenoides rupestris]|nr:hypothetical protein CRUP_000839 [Coryphaenoides rupestris]
MTPAWVPLLSALLVVVTMAAEGEGDLSRCAEVRTSSLGSELTASCVIRPDCPALSLGGGVTNIELHLDSRLLARSSHAPVAHGNSSSIAVGNSSVTVGNVRKVTAVVANFTQSRAWVTCCIRTSPCELVGGVKVQARPRFDPPRLDRVWPVVRRYGCLRLRWSLSAQQSFMSTSRMTLEARVRPPTLQTSTWTLATIRTCYQGSPWSGWSRPHSGHTLEKAPVGLLDYWVKVPEERKGKTSADVRNVRLFWKPSSQFLSNGRALSYVVSLPAGRGWLCFTPDSSSHSAICDITVVSHDDRALLVQWQNCSTSRWGRTASDVTDYVVEWWPMFKTNSSLLLFEVANRNQSSVLLTGFFEPYQPYKVSVYPRFKYAIGHPKTATAYSRQKAPSLVPDLKVKFSWGSYVELTWEELPLQERNGIITGYQLFYWDNPEHITVVTHSADNRRVLLRGLSKVTSYRVLLAASTDGGTNNGSVIIFKTLATDASDVGVVVALFFIGLSLVTFITFVAFIFSYQECVRVRLCPMIPDPAHSSVKILTSDMLQELSWEWPGNADPPVVHLSHLSLMEVSEKKMIQQWSDPEDTSDLGDSLCGSPVTPNFPVTPCGSVSYATIICSCPYAGQPANPPPAYLRSESTQPLLESESYHNMATHDDDDVGTGEGVGSDVGSWAEFPMLQALALADAPE